MLILLQADLLLALSRGSIQVTSRAGVFAIFGNGDSGAFISPHVARFAKLKDGSILVLTIPWSLYKGIPMQITFENWKAKTGADVINVSATYRHIRARVMRE